MDYGMMLKQNHPNPGRRSAHHARQSRFEGGSNRQLRSRMLRAVTNHRGDNGRGAGRTARGRAGGGEAQS